MWSGELIRTAVLNRDENNLNNGIVREYMLQIWLCDGMPKKTTVYCGQVEGPKPFEFADVLRDVLFQNEEQWDSLTENLPPRLCQSTDTIPIVAGGLKSCSALCFFVHEATRE